MCSYFLRVLISKTPLCSVPSPLFSELWQRSKFMTPLFGLRMLWLPEMRMGQFWLIAVRHPQMPKTMLAISVGVTVTMTTLNTTQ